MGQAAEHMTAILLSIDQGYREHTHKEAASEGK